MWQRHRHADVVERVDSLQAALRDVMLYLMNMDAKLNEILRTLEEDEDDGEEEEDLPR